MEKLERGEELNLFRYFGMFLTLSYLKIHLVLYFSDCEYPHKRFSMESCQQK